MAPCDSRLPAVAHVCPVMAQAQYMDASSRLDQQSRANSDTAGASAAVARSLGEVRKDYEAKLRSAEARAETAEEKAKHLEQELDRVCGGRWERGVVVRSAPDASLGHDVCTDGCGREPSGRLARCGGQ